MLFFLDVALHTILEGRDDNKTGGNIEILHIQPKNRVGEIV